MDESAIAQVVLAYLGSRIVEVMKNATGLPWMTEQTDRMNKLVGALIAFIATLGITVAGTWDGTTHTYTLVIGGLDFGNVLALAWGWLTQFVLQQMAYHGIVKKAVTT